MSDLQTVIDAAWEDRASIGTDTRGATRDAVRRGAGAARRGRGAGGRAGRRGRLAGEPMAEEGGAAVVPAER